MPLSESPRHNGDKAWHQLRKNNLSKAEMARRMATSRSALDRLLDPENSSVTLQTLQSAAQALGGKLRIELDFKNRAA